VEKKRYFMGFLYDFASMCRFHVKEGHTDGKLITDMDQATHVGATSHRRLAYYLYPIIIRGREEAKNPDYLIYFHKQNADTLIPEGYVVRVKIDDSNLLAIRRDLL